MAKSNKFVVGPIATLLMLIMASWVMPGSYLSLIPQTVMAQAPDLIIDKQVSNQAPSPGEKFTYLIRYRCAGIEEHCTNAQVSDVIPAPLTIVDYTRAGGNVASVEQNGNELTWHLETVIDTPGQLSSGSSGSITIDVRVPACGETDAQYPEAGTLLSSLVNFTADNAVLAASTAGRAEITMPELDSCPFPEIEDEDGFRKSDWNERFANPGNPRVTYEIFLVDSEAPYRVEDFFPHGTTLESIQLGNLTDSGGGVELLCAGNWVNLAATLSDRLNNQIDVPQECNTEQALGTGVAYWFTNAEAVRFTTPENYDADEQTPITLVFLLAPEHPVGGVLRNTAILYEPNNVDLNGDGIVGDIVYSHADKLVVEPSMMGSIEVDEFIFPGYVDDQGISILNGNNELPGRILSDNTNHTNLNLGTVHLAKNDVVWKYRAQMRNDATIGMNWVNPVMVVDLPEEMEFVQDPEIGNFVQVGLPNKTAITAGYDPYNSENCKSPEVTVIDNYNNSGRTRVRMDFPGCTIYGGLQQYNGIALYFSSRLKNGVSIGDSLTIDFRMYDENGQMFRCFGNDTIYKNWCGTSSKITVPDLPVESYATLESFLFAKGDLDTEYHRFPQLGFTDTSGRVDYEAHVINTGNISYRYLDLVDVLPHLNDYGVTTSVPRNSSWEQELRDAVVIERLDLVTREWTPVSNDEIAHGPYYSNSTNPCRLGSSSAEIYIDNGLAVSPSGCDPNVWGPASPEPIGMRSLGLRWLPPEGFQPKEEIRINIPAQQINSDDTCAVFTDLFGTGDARADLPSTVGTDLIFDSTGSIEAGGYALVDALLGTENDSGTKWHNIPGDITSDDTDGRMMVINASGVVGELYRRTVTDLNPGDDYSITVWVVNAQDGASANLSTLTMSAEPAGGGVPFVSSETAPITAHDNPKWQAYSFGFTANATSVDFVLSTTE